MDVLKLAVLAFIAAGVLLAISGVSAVKAVIVSGTVTFIVMAIAVLRSRRAPNKKPEDDTPHGPTIK
jgi:drug/metabolite transporter (DMT)-like permease